MAMDASSAPRVMTVRLVELLTVPELAAIVVVPGLAPLASPEESTVATVGLEELQMTELVRS